MDRTLSVDVNRQSVHSIEPEVRQFETSESFVVELTNHGSATHVHLNVDDGLADAISLDGGNHFLEAGRSYRIEASVDQRSRPVSGRLKIVTGYGAETAVIDISLIPPEESPEKVPVEVDERLSKPQPRQDSPQRSRGSSGSRSRRSRTSRGDDGLPMRVIAAGALVALALLFVVVGALIAGNPAVILGVGIVLVAIAGAAALLYSS
ncbi:DUF7524 family protein [Halalkalicoccus tibetensis]|uniref:Uncharacterized protein n=1 Tax=Halalkalicoccus tibetensis TaxID=175632 RepID=A0ABD5V2M0_9EURY